MAGSSRAQVFFVSVFRRSHSGRSRPSKQQGFTRAGRLAFVVVDVAVPGGGARGSVCVGSQGERERGRGWTCTLLGAMQR